MERERQFSYLLQKVDNKIRDFQRYVDSLKQWLEGQPDGSHEVICKRARKHKSLNQLGYAFGCVLDTIKEVFDDRGYDTSFIFNLEKPTGNEISIDLLKEYLYNVCGVRDEKGIVRLSRANTLQANQFIDAVRNHAVTQWGICIDDPCKNWKERRKATDG